MKISTVLIWLLAKSSGWFHLLSVIAGLALWERIANERLGFLSSLAFLLCLLLFLVPCFRFSFWLSKAAWLNDFMDEVAKL
jgi:hypothetical protein